MFGLRRRVARARGAALVAAVLVKFDTMVEDLRQAVEDCQQDLAANEATITALQSANADLRTTEARAIRVAENLRKLVD